MTVYLLTVLGIILAIQMVLLLVAYRFRADRWVEAGHAAMFLAVALYGLLSYGFDWGKGVLFIMISTWALRLAVIAFLRNWRTGRTEQFSSLRGRPWTFARQWLFQAVSVWVGVLPAMVAFGLSEVACDALSVVGFFVWLTGFGIEVVADWQRYRFKRRVGDRDGWIDTGLWRYSRHPNYFGEIVLWAGLYLYVLSSFSVEQALVTVIGPLSVAWLVMRVNGVAPLERSADERWGKNGNYQAYKARTSLLIIFPPKS